MFNIVFCDDNSQYLISLRTFIKRLCAEMIPKSEDYEIGPAFGNAVETIEYIRNNHTDVLFLDIDMPHMGGFECAKIICEEFPYLKIVFISAYDNFVYNSFDYLPFAFLRKSHLSEELPKLLKRIVEKMSESDCQLILSTQDGMKKVTASSITYVEIKGNYYTVHMVYGKEYICRGTLKALEQQMEKMDFFRSHSSFLINLEHIDHLPENGIVSVNGSILPIAQKRRKGLKQVYMEYIRRNLNI